ncbi:MAG: transport-associated protein [Verrucomicrobiales bacterium]|nr:transport-associated protein [Verrucomicrobiales bacterium]
MKKLMSSFSMVAALAAIVSVATFSVGCAGDRTHRSTGAYLDDKSIATKVKADLIGDPDVKAAQVKVNVFKGDVQLSGFVDSDLQKQKAEQIARNVNGVNYVRNDLVVRSANEPAGSQRRLDEPLNK